VSRRATIGDALAVPVPDLIGGDFTAERPNKLWVADITYRRTWAGWLCVAAVLDAYSRMVVGRSMREDLRAELVVDATRMAIWRRDVVPGALIHHSDRGSQYTSFAFGRTLRESGIAQSMGSRGDAYDSAVAEPFMSSLRTELVDRRSWPTRRAARLAIYEYIEGWYNTHRRQSSLGHLRPAEFERITPPAERMAAYSSCPPERGHPSLCDSLVNRVFRGAGDGTRTRDIQLGSANSEERWGGGGTKIPAH
jgi:putative transposase